MKNKCILKCVLFALVAFNSLAIMAQTTQQAAKPEKKFLQPERVRYDGSCMTIEGKDIFIYSAAFHYFRCPEELWRDRFRQIKEAGFNTVETYVPWNWHERIMPSGLNDNSHFDFSDVKRWLKMAQEEFGLYTIVRPGPFICAEYSGGGYPRWLAKFCPGGMDDFWLRSADHRHISWSQHWFDAVCKALADEQITRKPVGEKGIILIQIENEYNHHGCYGKEKLLKALYQSVRKSGMDIPIFTCLTNECRSSEDVELSQVFDSDNYYVGLSSAPDCAYRMANLRKEQPDAPGFVTELQGGWFSLVTGRLSEDHYSDARHFKAVGLMSLLGGAGGINYYMFFGGTHFAGWGARGMTTSYDYNAAIRENGARSDKYFEAKAIGQFIQAFEPQLVRSEGGPCAMEGGAKSLFGGVRVAVDGTRFVFLHNTDPKNAIRGKVRLLPGKMNRPATPMYNINQHGEKVLIAASEAADTDSVTVSPINVSYDLPALGTKVLVIPAGKPETKGEWWPQEQIRPLRPAKLPQPVRIASALKKEDAFAKADWKQLPRLVSLPDLGVNDFRYSLYRAQVSLTSRQVAEERFLLFNMFTRDIVSVAVNGKQAKRLFPDRADAQFWTTRDCFERIRPDEYDNRFDVSGLLKVKDAIGRRWQLGTIQVDYNLPERFELEYTGEDNKKHRPVMIHRAPFGSMERFVAVLIEHTGGKFPLWLTPDQVAILPISEKFNDYAYEVKRQLEAEDLSVLVDDRNEKIGRKIRDTELKRIPYMLIVGEKEAENNEVSVRKQGEGDKGSMKITTFAALLKGEVEDQMNHWKKDNN